MCLWRSRMLFFSRFMVPLYTQYTLIVIYGVVFFGGGSPVSSTLRMRYRELRGQSGRRRLPRGGELQVRATCFSKMNQCVYVGLFWAPLGIFRAS